MKRDRSYKEVIAEREMQMSNIQKMFCNINN